jgi:uncharacterized membrane protein
MMYVISFLAVAAVPLAVAGYGGHLAAKVLEGNERRRALAIVWVLAALGVLLSGVQQMMAYRADRMHVQQQAALEAKAEQEQRELQMKLDASLSHQEEVRQELGSIVSYLHTPQPRMSGHDLAVAASRMVEDAMHR